MGRTRGREARRSEAMARSDRCAARDFTQCHHGETRFGCHRTAHSQTPWRCEAAACSPRSRFRAGRRGVDEATLGRAVPGLHRRRDAPGGPPRRAAPSPCIGWRRSSSRRAGAGRGPPRPRANSAKGRLKALLEEAGPQGLSHAQISDRLHDVAPNTLATYLSVMTTSGEVERHGDFYRGAPSVAEPVADTSDGGDPDGVDHAPAEEG